MRVSRRGGTRGREGVSGTQCRRPDAVSCSGAHAHGPQRDLQCESSLALGGSARCTGESSNAGAAMMASQGQRESICNSPPYTQFPSAAPAGYCQLRTAWPASCQRRAPVLWRSCIRPFVSIILFSLLATSPARAGDLDCLVQLLRLHPCIAFDDLWFPSSQRVSRRF